MKKQRMPNFKNVDQEADWWASRPGREYVKQRSAAETERGVNSRGSRLVAGLPKKTTVQIAIRLLEADLDQARILAEQKGIGYQTLIKMLVHEGLKREIRR